MKYLREADGRLVVSLMRGDMVRVSIEELCARENIVSARITAIGGLEDPEIGWWDMEKQTYHKRVFSGIWELLSMDGNISLLDGRPFLHAHVALSAHDYNVIGGHFFTSKVGILMECFIDPYASPLPRRMCDSLGLPRWEPGG